MLENHSYNLMNQLVQEHKSLWRIKQSYQEDAKDCADCQGFWTKMIADKEQHIEELTKLIKGHL